MVRMDNACKCSLPGHLLDRLHCATRLEKGFLYDEIFVQECYSCREQGYIVDIEDGWTIVDIGANIGLFTLFCAEKGRGRHPRIIAVEPVPKTYEYLQHNIELYNETQGRAEIVPLQVAVGASGHDDDVDFVMYPHAPGWNCQSGIAAENATSMKHDLKVFIMNSVEESSTSLPRWLVCIGRFLLRIAPWMVSWTTVVVMWFLMRGAQRIRCPCMTVSRMLEVYSIDHVDLLKVDVEGSELLVLQGIHDWKRISRLVAEVHEKNLHEVEILCRQHFSRVYIEQAHDMKGTSLWMVYCSQ